MLTFQNRKGLIGQLKEIKREGEVISEVSLNCFYRPEDVSDKKYDRTFNDTVYLTTYNTPVPVLIVLLRHERRKHELFSSDEVSIAKWVPGVVKVSVTPLSEIENLVEYVSTPAHYYFKRKYDPASQTLFPQESQSLSCSC